MTEEPALLLRNYFLNLHFVLTTGSEACFFFSCIAVFFHFSLSLFCLLVKRNGSRIVSGQKWEFRTCQCDQIQRSLLFGGVQNDSSQDLLTNGSFELPGGLVSQYAGVARFGVLCSIIILQ